RVEELLRVIDWSVDHADYIFRVVSNQHESIDPVRMLTVDVTNDLGQSGHQLLDLRDSDFGDLDDEGHVHVEAVVGLRAGLGTLREHAEGSGPSGRALAHAEEGRAAIVANEILAVCSLVVWLAEAGLVGHYSSVLTVSGCGGRREGIEAGHHSSSLDVETLFGAEIEL
ncbi:hypothetical protein PENTCL1PPCAC_13426, partial [Pristionchus entomophagus]